MTLEWRREGKRSTFQMPEKQGDKDNMSGGEAATKKSCNLL